MILFTYVDLPNILTIEIYKFVVIWYFRYNFGHGRTPPPHFGQCPKFIRFFLKCRPLRAALNLEGAADAGRPSCPYSWLRRSPIVNRRARQLVHTEAYSGYLQSCQ